MNPNRYLGVVGCLTKQEWRVLALVAGLLLMGWWVKFYRAAHPPEHGAARADAVMQPAKP